MMLVSRTAISMTDVVYPKLAHLVPVTTMQEDTTCSGYHSELTINWGREHNIIDARFAGIEMNIQGLILDGF